MYIHLCAHPTPSPKLFIFWNSTFNHLCSSKTKWEQLCHVENLYCVKCRDTILCAFFMKLCRGQKEADVHFQETCCFFVLFFVKPCCHFMFLRGSYFPTHPIVRIAHNVVCRAHHYFVAFIAAKMQITRLGILLLLYFVFIFENFIYICNKIWSYSLLHPTHPPPGAMPFSVLTIHAVQLLPPARFTQCSWQQSAFSLGGRSRRH